MLSFQKKLSQLYKLGYQTFCVNYIQTDLKDLVESFWLRLNQEKIAKKKLIYYWSPGSDFFEVCQDFSGERELIPSEIKATESNLLEVILETKAQGIFLIDDWLTRGERYKKEAQIQNFVRQKRMYLKKKLILFLKSDPGNSEKLSTEVPTLKYGLPDSDEISSLPMVKELVEKQGNAVIHSLLGLSRGQIRYANLLWRSSELDFFDFIYEYKLEYFRSMGMEFIAAPDVDKAGGLQLLQNYLQTISQLNEVTAANYKLAPPKGLLLLGVPGTGKTLCAKFAAKKLGYSLIGFSWSNILGAENSDRALSNILEIADTIDRVVLLADDFDKGFTGWGEGGASMRLSQKLLTWMQEHTSRVLTIATVNRIGLLPAELKRRFDDGGIWFVDLPNMSEMQEIFLMYLAKYFPAQFAIDPLPWDEKIWYKLLKQYRGSTPVEIKNAIVRCAIEKYCNLSPQQKLDRVAIKVSVEDLLAQLKQFVKSIDRDGEDIRKIRRNGALYNKANAPDTSNFNRGEVDMFNYKVHELERG